MKLIIAGSRGLIPTLKEIGKAMEVYSCCPTQVVCGCAIGIDRLGAEWARKAWVPIEFFPAWPDQYDWADEYRLSSEVVHNHFGRSKSAGPRRNKAMADYADALLAIHDGKSRGTANMIELMDRLGKPYHVIIRGIA